MGIIITSKMSQANYSRHRLLGQIRSITIALHSNILHLHSHLFGVFVVVVRVCILIYKREQIFFWMGSMSFSWVENAVDSRHKCTKTHTHTNTHMCRMSLQICSQSKLLHPHSFSAMQKEMKTNLFSIISWNIASVCARFMCQTSRERKVIFRRGCENKNKVYTLTTANRYIRERKRKKNK